jgi:uncharacterized protein (DUF4415 family)
MKREYDFSKGKRGAVVPPEPGKTRITIRLDNQILINEALREYIRRGRIEAAVRRAVREELREAGL